MSQTDLIVAENKTTAICEAGSLAFKGTRKHVSKTAKLPVKPVMATEACESWAFPENARRLMAALLGYRFLARAPVLPVHQRGGGDLTEHIQHREEGEEHKQEEYVEVASHFALHAFCANWTFLLVLAAPFVLPVN